MMIKEMDMHMAYPESCFQAATPEACVEQIQNYMLDENSAHHCKISFRSMVESLCKEFIPQDNLQTLAYLGPLNLFAAIAGEIIELRLGICYS